MQQAPRNLPLKLLTQWTDNPRASFDPARHAELVASLRAVGLLQPLLVRPKGDGFEVVAGNRRLRALTELHADVPWDVEVACLVREIDDGEAIVIALAENTDREELRPLEEAAAYGRLRTLGHGPDEIAARVAKSTSYVRNRLRLLELHLRARALVEQDRITLQSAFMLAQLTAEKQEQALRHLGELDDGPFVDGHDETDEDLEWRRRPISMDRVRSAISRVSRSLATARFPIVDALAGVAACTDCPKRTGAQATLFKHFGHRDDECLDETCFDAKTKAHSDKLIADAKKTDRLLDKKACRQLFRGDAIKYGSGFVTAKQKPHLRNDVDPPTYGDLARRADRASDIVVAVDGVGLAVELVPEDVAHELRCKAQGESPTANGSGDVDADGPEMSGPSAPHERSEREWKKEQKAREARDAADELARIEALLSRVSETEALAGLRVIVHALAEASFLNSCRRMVGLPEASERIHLPADQMNADLHATIASAGAPTLLRLALKSVFDRAYATATRRALLELGNRQLDELVAAQAKPAERSARKPRVMKTAKKTATTKRKRAA